MKSLKGTIINLLPARLFNSLRVLARPEYYLPLTEITYREDGLVTQHNADFMKDERFARAYKLGESTNSWNGWQTHWRSHVACWAADRAKALAGDFVECGVNKGAISLMVMEYIGFAAMKDRKFYLLDTYEGLADEYLTDEERAEGRAEKMKYEPCFDVVQKTFSRFENVVLVKGAIPDSLPQAAPEKVCYLSIDMNNVTPEIAAAEYFWDRMVSGAAMLLDDYGWLGHQAQKRAFDDFARHRNAPLLSLPTGQGLIIKP